MSSLACLWMGLLAALGPCALGPSLAALFYLAGGSMDGTRFLRLVLPWAVGRFTVYSVLAILALSGLFASKDLAFFVQSQAPRFIGPAYLICGLFLLHLMPWRWEGSRLHARAMADASGPRSSGIFSLYLGALSALAFCPAAAALFFTGLLPMAARDHSWFWYPVAFSAGSLVPVLLFSILLGFGLGMAGRVFRVARFIERTSRIATGVLFLGVGGWESYKALIRPLL